MKRKYEEWRPGSGAQDVLDKANDILAEYARQGYSMTLRQVYYQFVRRLFIPNTMREYKRLGEILNRGRLAGLVDWSAMQDLTRNIDGGDGADWSPAELVRYYGQSFDVTRWDGQSAAVEVWVEKEALANVVSRAAAEWRVPWFACRGYVSQSEMRSAALRLAEHLAVGRNVLVLHLGDHDPSGIDMTRDIRERLEQFISMDWLCDRMLVSQASLAQIRADIFEGLQNPDAAGTFGVEVRRIALNSEQIERYGLPPNPTKLTDSRAGDYIARFGRESWELDGMEPQALVDLIGDNIRPLIDQDLWAQREVVRDEQRREFGVVADNWDEIQEQFA